MLYLTSRLSTKSSWKARALENCFPTYVFVFRQMCLFEGLNTMEMGTMEMHSWGVEALEVLTQSLILLCDGLNATCFSLLCVGSFSTIYNKQQSSMKDRRNLLTFFSKRLMRGWLSSGCCLWKENSRENHCVSYFLPHSKMFIYTWNQVKINIKGRLERET